MDYFFFITYLCYIKFSFELMAKYDDLLEALQGMNRSFGREDLSGTWETLLAKMDDNLNTEKELLEDKKRSLEEQKRHTTNTEVINALDKEIQKLTDALQKNQNKKDSLDKGSAISYGKRAALERLGGEKSYAVFNKGKSIKQTGEAIAKLGKGFKGLGGGVAKVGGLMTKLAGPIGLVIQGLQIAYDWYKKSTELEIQRQEFNAKDVVQQHKIKQRELQTAAQIVSNNANVANTAQSAMASAASAAQSAAGAFAQEVVGIHSELAVAGKKIVYDAYANSHEIASSMPFDIKAGMYKAAETAISFASQARGYNINEKYADEAIGIAAQKMSNQISGAMASASAQMKGAAAVAAISNAAAYEKRERDVSVLRQEQNVGRKDMEYQQSWAQTMVDWGPLDFLPGLVKNVNDISQNAKMSPLKTELQMNQARAATANAKTDILASVATTNAQLKASAEQTNIQLATQARDMNLSIQKQQIDMKKNIEQSAKDAADKIAMAWLKMTEKLNDTFLKHQQASTVMGREMGMTGRKLETYSEKMGQYQVEIAKWGKDLEWMQKFQSGYQESSGRNVEMSQRDFETSAALGLNVGDETVAQYVGGMEIFNHSVEDSNEKLYTMFKEVSKIGLNGKKYAKELANNLKLAEKFNFKGGVDGLMKMSKWAQNMRFNVASMDGMLDKVQEGGLEGIIQQSAELQVLGGNFAMGSDPLAMAYESYMDPEGYAKRMNGMLAGQGVFDSKTGEVSFGIASQQMMRQYAKSTGQDYKDVLNQARAQVKLGQIGNKLGGDFTDDQKSLVANKAQYDAETGRWQVQIGKEKKDISSLTKEDIEALTPADPTEIQQNMLDELKGVRSVQEEMNGKQIENMARLETSVWTPLKETNERIIASIGDDFNRNFNKYQTEALRGLSLMENSQKSWIEMFEQGNSEVDKEVDAINNAAQQICATIQGVNSFAESHMAAAMSQSVPTYGVGTMQINAPSMPSDEEEPFLDESTSKTFNWGLIGGGMAAGAAVGGVLGGTIGVGVGGVGGAIAGAGAGAAPGAAVGGATGAAAGAINGALIGATAGLVAATLEYCGVIDDGAAAMESFNGWCNDSAEAVSKWTDEVANDISECWDDFTKWGSNAWDGITNFAGNTWQSFMKTDIGKGLSIVYNYISKGVSTVVGDIKIGWNNIKEVASAIWTPIKDTAISVWNGIKETASAIWTPIKDTAISVWGSIKDTASSIWGNIKDVACSAASAMWEGFKTMASNAWDGVKNIASGAWEAIKGVFTANFSRVWDGVKEVAIGVFKVIASPFEGLAKTVTDIVNGVKGFTGKLITAMADGFGRLVKGGWTMLKDWVSGVFDDGVVNSNGTPSKINDGLVIQNGKITRIDNNDQVLAAKTGGPVDRILDTIHSMSTVLPRPMSYDSYVKESPYGGGSNGGKIEIAPIQITINGSIQLNGTNGVVDITQQISNDPNFIRALTQMIAIEVEKKSNGGRASNVLNSSLQNA